MKSLLIGALSLAMTMPALAGTSRVSSAAGEKFSPAVQLNYTAVVRGAPRGAYRAGYRGYPYYGGYYGRRYPYYGYRYPYWGGGYWGGYYGYPYAAAQGFGLGIPLAYSAGYYAAAAPAYAYAAPQGYYNGRIVTDSAPGRVGPTNTGNSAARSVQSALKARGYYHGGVDGEFGPQSQQARAQFQQANGLKVTGLIDSSSLKALSLR